MLEVLEVYEEYDSCQICGNWFKKVYYVRINDKFQWICFGCYNNENEKYNDLSRKEFDIL